MRELTELSRFQPRSPLSSADASVRAAALRALTRGLEPAKPMHHRMSDVLSMVLALTARTRRMVHPRVSVEVDVFAPTGTRAVRLYLPEQD